MKNKIIVFDVDWDGAHFTAQHTDGLLEGHGSFAPNPLGTGGTVSGFIQRGPETFIGKLVTIEFNGQHGTCTLLK